MWVLSKTSILSMWVAAKLAFYYPMAASDNNQTGLYVFVRILHTGFFSALKMTFVWISWRVRPLAMMTLIRSDFICGNSAAQVLCNLIAAVRACDRACSAYWPKRHSKPQAIPVRTRDLSSLPGHHQPDKDQLRARENSETTRKNCPWASHIIFYETYIE